MMKRKILRFSGIVTVCICLLSTFFGWNTIRPAEAAEAHLLTGVPGLAGTTTAISGWQILSSASTSDNGASISKATYGTSGWLPVAARSTVLAGLIQNGKYPNVFYSTNLKNVDASQFQVPWWYRENFTIAAGSNLHTVLHLDGIPPSRSLAWRVGFIAGQIAGLLNPDLVETDPRQSLLESLTRKCEVMYPGPEQWSIYTRAIQKAACIDTVSIEGLPALESVTLSSRVQQPE